MYIRSIFVQQKVGSLYIPAPQLLPGNQTLSGLTPILVRPRSGIIRRPWGRAQVPRWSGYRVQGHLHVRHACLMLRDVICHPDALTAPTWLWFLACRCLRYVTGRPLGSVDMTRMDLLGCWVFNTIDLAPRRAASSIPATAAATASLLLHRHSSARRRWR